MFDETKDSEGKSVIKVTLAGSGRQKNYSRIGRDAGNLTLNDLRRLFEIEHALNEITGVRIHIEIVPADGEKEKF